MKNSHRLLEAGILLGLVIWLFAAAANVEIEYYDGYDAICNAGHFLGDVKRYAATRGPFFGLTLVPAEWWKQNANMHALEVRPHHFTMALFHSIYLLGSYLMLVRVRGRTPAALLAFVAAVPTFIFFTYAPFISHDILPGVIFLAMLLLAERFVESPRKKDAVFLVLLGAAAATIKHTYALFWFFVLGIQCILLILDGAEQRKARIKSFILLGACAVGSALIAAGTLGVAIKDSFPDQGFAERVIAQVKYLTFDAHDQSLEPPWWVYLRNFPAFGLLASLLILPALWISWKEERRIKGLVLAWLASVVVLHLIGIRQVRYLIFLMPVTACLIVPVVQRLLSVREGLAALLMVMLFTQFTRYSAAAELARPFTDFYRHSEARKLLDHHDFSRKGDVPSVVIMNSSMLSFHDGRNTPLTGDVYHNLFHLDGHHIVDLYQMPEGAFARLTTEEMNRLELWPDGSAMIVATAGILMNPVGWNSAPPVNSDLLVQQLYQSDSMTITRRSEIEYVTNEGQAFEIGPADFNGQPVHVMQADWLAKVSPGVVSIRVRLPGQKVPVYGSIHSDTQWVLPGFVPPPPGTSLALRYFRKTYSYPSP